MEDKLLEAKPRKENSQPVQGLNRKQRRAILADMTRKQRRQLKRM